MNKRLNIVYDTTALCPWNCPICCMGATRDKTCKSKELTRSQKLDIASQVHELQMNGYDVRMDLSGGEIFTDISVHKELLKALTKVLGKEKLGVSCSGYRIDRELAEFLGKTVSDVEMTMDNVPSVPYKLRPYGYNKAAANAVLLLKEAGCKVGIQTVVTKYNNSYEMAKAVFDWTCANDVDDWSILRFFPSGRGADYPDAYMTDSECEAYVHMVQEMVDASTEYHKPKVDFHYLMPGHQKYTNVCRCVRHSIGILPNGDVVACFWALDSNTDTVDSKYLLGNVKDNSLLEILNSQKAHYWSDCEHCCELGGGSNAERGVA